MSIIDRGQVLLDYIKKAPPLDVEQLTKDLGILIKHEYLSDADSAHITYDDKIKKYVITVNNSHKDNRKNFSIAHELGHFFLHREDISYGKYLMRSSMQDNLSPSEREKEIEANKFAANLLVHDSALNKYLTPRNEHISIEDLSDVFKVSTQVMKIRFKSYRRNNPDNARKVKDF